MADKESISHIFKIILIVSFFCSIMVASAAVLLRPKQISNQHLDRKRNVLIAAGIYDKGMSEDEILKKFNQIQIIVWDFKNKTQIPIENPDSIDMEKEAKDPDLSISLPPSEDFANIRRIPLRGVIYLSLQDGQIQRLILPIWGQGLWSTMYGFLSIEPDGNTIAGITFYEHSETPGLGAEIDNPKWQKMWVGKKLFNEKGEPSIQVIKGLVDPNKDEAKHQVDGISGATITARAVGNMVRFWTSDWCYGVFLKKFRLPRT